MSNLSAATEKRFHAGTLTYTLKQLLLSCTIVLLARMALSMIGYALVPTLTPILLDRAGANATQIAFIFGTIPSILSMILCPIVSTISDKTRTPWGRRTPYLLLSAPLLAGILILIGYSGSIAPLFAKTFPALSWNWQLIILAALFVLYQVVFQIPSSLVYYLEPDIVPQECFGRYSAFASILGSISGAAFGLFVTKHIETQTRLIVWIFGLSYLLIYILQALFAKEGSYPPVRDKISKEGGPLIHAAEYFLMFFRQFFSHKIYIAMAICCGLNAASNVCRTMYNVLFATKDLEVTLELFGKIGAVSGIASAVLVYFAGKLMDRTHPMLIFFLGGVMIVVVNVFGYFFAIGPKTFCVVAFTTSLMYAFQNLATIPLLARIFPMDKFGQLSSGNAMITHFIMIAATAFAGIVTKIFGYRVMFVWDFFVTIAALLALGVVFREWKRFGGRNYQPPEID